MRKPVPSDRESWPARLARGVRLVGIQRPNRKAVVGICLTLGVLSVPGYWLVQAGNEAAESHRKMRCPRHLTQIGLACLQYTNANGGEFPASLGQALMSGALSPDTFVCPMSQDVEVHGPTRQWEADHLEDGGHCSYLYFGKGVHIGADDASVVLACEPLGNHGRDGIFVLFAEGRVDDASRARALRILLNAASGQRPVMDSWQQDLTAPK